MFLRPSGAPYFSLIRRVAFGVGGGEGAAAQFARGVLLGVALAVLGPQPADLQAVLDQFAADVEVARHLDGTLILLQQPPQPRERHERRRADGVRRFLVRLVVVARDRLPLL